MALDLSKHVARVLFVVYCDILALLRFPACSAYSAPLPFDQKRM